MYPTLKITKKPNVILLNYGIDFFNPNLSGIDLIDEIIDRYRNKETRMVYSILFKKVISSVLPCKVDTYALLYTPIHNYCNSNEICLYRHLNKIILPPTVKKKLRYDCRVMKDVDTYCYEFGQSILKIIFYRLYSTEMVSEKNRNEMINLFFNPEEYREMKYKNQIVCRFKKNNKMIYKIKTKLDAKSVREMYIDYIKYCNDSKLPFLEKVLHNTEDQEKLLEIKKKYSLNKNKMIYTQKNSMVGIIKIKIFDFWKEMLFCYCNKCQTHSLTQISTKTSPLFTYQIPNNYYICTSCFRKANVTRIKGHMIYVKWEKKNYWQCLGCGNLCCEGKCEKKCSELSTSTCYMRTEYDTKSCKTFILNGIPLCYNHYKHYTSEDNLKICKITCKNNHHMIRKSRKFLSYGKRKRKKFDDF